MMMKFKEYNNKLNESVEDLEKIFGDKFSDFALQLSAYIDYNDKDSADELLNYYPELKKAGLIESPKVLYRLVRLERISDYKINSQQVTSASKKRFPPSFLKDMKKMVNQWKKTGKFYCLIITDAKGLDVNKLYKVFKGKKRYLIKKYDTLGNMNFDVLYDSFENKKYQKEFIIFGDYKVKDLILV